VLIPLLLQTLLGYPAVQAGIAMAPRGLGSFVAMPLVGMMIAKFDARKMLAIGLAVCAYTLIEFSRFSLSAGYWDFFWPQLIMGLSLGFLFVPLTTTTMDPIPRERMGNATSLFNLVRNLGGSVGISAVETIQFRQAQAHIHHLGAHINPLDPGAESMIQHLQGAFIGGGTNPVTAGHQAYAAVWGLVQQQATMMSYNDVFRLLGAIFFAMLPLILLMKRARGRAGMTAH
jgi:DHA2 family multidrug resistance protein